MTTTTTNLFCGSRGLSSGVVYVQQIISNSKAVKCETRVKDLVVSRCHIIYKVRNKK